MKKCFCLSLVNLIVIPALLSFLFSCTTSRSTGSKYEKVMYEATDLVQKSKLSAAKKMILEAISKDKPKPSPFVENRTLCFYSSNPTMTLGKLLYAAAFSADKDNDSVRKNPGDFKPLFDLYEKTPWDKSIVIEPEYPTLYFILGSICISEGNYVQAIKYLDTSTIIFPGLGSAWAEMLYAYTYKKEFTKAKEIGKKALEIEDVRLDNIGRAAILRRLGYIAVEENDLDLGEKYYKESLKYNDHEVARQELKYIEKLRTKM